MQVAMELALGLRDALLARCAARPHLGLQVASRVITVITVSLTKSPSRVASPQLSQG